MGRLTVHPVLPVREAETVTFFFDGKPLTARKGEVISSALFAHGIRTFGRHPADNAPQGIFCANGQCAQCLVMADGLPVKACMEVTQEGMHVQSLRALPEIPDVRSDQLHYSAIETVSTDLLVIGAGPAGLGAAIEAADAGLDVLVVDDKGEPGGKLLLQTHTFFGSVNECYAGTRGLDIACILALEAEKRTNIALMMNTMAVGVYGDGKVGILSNGIYKIVRAKSLLVAAGAREKALSFPGCDLPGVYGAGAFQTLLNRDLVSPGEQLFIIGGGNVGIIAGYHALQAGIRVIGLAEGLPDVGGYWVHADKLRRLGVPIHTSTTVVSANGTEAVESVTVAKVDKNWKIVPGSHQTYPCDTLLMAVGLSRINELYEVAKKFGMDAHLAGDAEEIAEASAAMFSGRVTGRKIAKGLGKPVIVPAQWEEMTQVLKSKPGHEDFPIHVPAEVDVFPVFSCVETIPCNPCSAVCSQEAVSIPSTGGILGCPQFSGNCTACLRCVAACPGLAVTLVDRRSPSPTGKAKVTLAFEMPLSFAIGDQVRTVAHRGEDTGYAKVLDISPKSAVAPCTTTCPADVRAPAYIELIRKGQFQQAAQTLRRDLPLPSVCGRVCYSPCEDKCSRGDLDEPVAICALKRFVSDWAMENDVQPEPQPQRHKDKVAVVGSGPSGLACANELNYRGYSVTVFERAERAGGLLRYGIPAYRLPDSVLDWELRALERSGIEIRTGTKISDLSRLLQGGFGSVFIGVGAQAASPLGIKGDTLSGVVGMLDFLHDVNTGSKKAISGKVAIIGGGNSAMDAARAAIRLGADEVKVVYRRLREQMPAHNVEVEEAEAEGVIFDFLTLPVEVISGDNNQATALRCAKMRLGEPDASGRPRPVRIEGSEFDMPVDLVVAAIGQAPHPEAHFDGLATDRWGSAEANPISCLTSLPGVFAGGDAVTGAATVVEAFGAGKRAAESIDRYLRGVDLLEDREPPATVTQRNLSGLEKKPRVEAKALPVAQRQGNFKEIIAVVDEKSAIGEAQRCLGCGFQPGTMPGPAIMNKYPVTPGRTRTVDNSVLITLEVDSEAATRVAGIRIQDEEVSKPIQTVMPPQSDDDVVLCRCERISLGDIRRAILAGVHDMNGLKAMLNVGLGACGGKTCGPLIETVFRREGISLESVTPFTERPLATEVPMGVFAGVKPKTEPSNPTKKRVKP